MVILMYKNKEQLFNSISHSKFRSSFHLNIKMKEYAKKKGINVIEKHAYDFVNERLKPACPKNDGKQTPMRQVHPVFIAQHATGTCCRSCLYKWHSIPMYRELTDAEVNYVVSMIISFIEKELNNM